MKINVAFVLGACVMAVPGVAGACTPGGGWSIQSFSPETGIVPAGSTARMELYGSLPYRASLVEEGGVGREVALTDVFSNGNLHAGGYITFWAGLTVPADLTPGAYTLVLTGHEGGTSETPLQVAGTVPTASLSGEPSLDSASVVREGHWEDGCDGFWATYSGEDAPEWYMVDLAWTVPAGPGPGWTAVAFQRGTTHLVAARELAPGEPSTLAGRTGVKVEGAPESLCLTLEVRDPLNQVRLTRDTDCVALDAPAPSPTPTPDEPEDGAGCFLYRSSQEDTLGAGMSFLLMLLGAATVRARRR